LFLGNFKSVAVLQRTYEELFLVSGEDEF